MKVFLTGGTGLIGSHVAERLRNRGVPVTCLQRAASDTTFLRSIGCRIVGGDVRDDPERTAAAMEGCDSLVHAAALVYADATWPRVRAVNVEGTERVLRSAVRAGVARAVHISSVAVYGRLAPPVDESSSTDRPLRPTNLYGRSKREAEAVALELHRQGALDVRVVRPSAVYGERDRIFAPTLARLLSWPLVPMLGSGTNTVPAVYAGNVAAGVDDALEREGVGGRAFNLAEDDPVTQRDLLAGLARGLGVRPRFLPVPEGLVRSGARLGESVGLRPPGARDLPLRRLAELALNDNPYRSDRARRELRWRPPHSAASALERTGRWFGRGEEDGDEADRRDDEGRGRDVE